MNCNYKVKLDDIQNKYKFNIFCTGSYNDSDLRKMIESVFYALPRTTASGTSVTLNDTARSYMHNELNATDTSQYTTTGSNKFTDENLYGNSGNTTVSIIDKNNLTLSVSSGTYQRATFNVDCKANTDYTFTAKIKNSNSNQTKQFIQIRGENSGTLITDGNFDNGSIITFNSGSYSRISIVLYGTTSVDLSNVATWNDIQLVEGTYTSQTMPDYEKYTGGIPSPNPDYPQVIHTITGDNTITSCGKNLFNKDNVEINKWIQASGEKSIRDGAIVSDYIEVDNSASYKLTGLNTFTNTNYYTISQYNSSKQWLSSREHNIAVGTNLNATIDSNYLNSNCKYIIISIYKYVGYINNVQFEKGSATSYQPYQSNSVLLTLGDKEVCKIGNYEDKIFKAIKGNEIYDSLSVEEKNTLDYGKWYLRKNIGKVNINSFVATEYGNLFRASRSDYLVQNALSNYFVNVVDSSIDGNNKANQNLSLEQFTFRDGSTKDRMYVKTSLTAEQLNSLNAPFYYVLATPTNEKFNDTIQEQLEDIYNNMLSYEGQTNVSQVNDDLPFNINSTALKDLNNL